MHGRIVWLTQEQGGRASGPPASSDDYAVTAFVPPGSIESGLASFVVRCTDPGRWVSKAAARWLVPQQDPRLEVQPGTVVVVTEGARVVGYFHVDALDR